MTDVERRPFVITPSAEKVALDGERKATASFTVTSNIGSVRARALAVPEAPARADWFEVMGPAERRLERTEQYAVKIAVPAGTKEGDYVFRLKVVSEEKPDEVYTDGPAVAVVVPASVAPKKAFPWWILVVAAAVLVLAAGLIWWLTRAEPLVVPPLAEVAEAEAVAMLAELCEEPQPCLQAEVSREASSEIAAGTVISSDPEAGAEVEPGDAIALVVSSGVAPVLLPPVEGRSEAEASGLLTALCQPEPCLQVHVDRQPSATIAKDLAIATVPAAGEQVPVGAEVTLVLSGGPATVELPNVDNLPQQQATTRLEQACQPRPCVKVVAVQEGSWDIDDGRVIRTVPVLPSAVSPGSQVTLVVSRVLAKGERAMTEQGTIDLDTGDVRVPTSQADLWFDVNGGALQAGFDFGKPGRKNKLEGPRKTTSLGGRGRAAGPRVPAGPNGCLKNLQQSAREKVSLQQLQVGQYLCVMTTEGNVSEVKIVDLRVQPQRGSLTVELRTWSGAQFTAARMVERAMQLNIPQ